jgi:hypothetical protein
MAVSQIFAFEIEHRPARVAGVKLTTNYVDEVRVPTPIARPPDANDNTPPLASTLPQQRALNSIASLHLLDHQHRIGAEPVQRLLAGLMTPPEQPRPEGVDNV